MKFRAIYVFLSGTLRGRMIISVAAVHAVMMTLFITDLTLRQRSMLLERQHENAAALAETLSTSAAGWIESNDISGLQELVDAQLRYPELAFAILTDEDGRILAHTDKARIGQTLLDLPKEARQTLISGAPALVDIAVPAMLGGKHVGWVRVGIGQTASGDKLARIISSGILYALGAILVGSFIAWLMGRRITRRLYSVQDTINKVRAGNNSARSNITGTDEAALLAGEFNAMLDALAQRDADLGKSEKKYGALIEKIRVAVIVHGPDTRILTSNLMAQELLGLSEDQLMGKSGIDPAWHFFREDGTVMLHEEYPVNRVFSTRRPLMDYMAGIHRPGSNDNVWVLVNADPVLDEKGAIAQVIITFVDITGRKKAEDALRASEERFSMALEVGNAGVWEWSKALDKIYLDARFHSILGYTPGELPTTLKEWLTYHHPDDIPVWMAKVQKYLEGETPVFESEHRIRGKDGTWNWVFTKARLVDPSAAEGSKQFLGIAMNVTERKRAELKIQKLNRDLIAKNEEMENFLYITTHDLRSPLVNIQGFSQNIERYNKETQEILGAVELPPEIKGALMKLAGDRIPDALKFVLGSANKMNSLISALLKVSRTGRMEMKPETVEMNGLVQKILDSLRYQLGESGGKVHLGSLPQCQADPGAVSQLFTNLLDNAIKYRHKDRAPEITVSGEVKGDAAVYMVTDNGSGIPAADIHRIWDIFYSPENAAAKKGEGIGLPIVKRIIEKAGGSIRVESKEGEGSVFCVELPLPS